MTLQELFKTEIDEKEFQRGSPFWNKIANEFLDR
jgi:hypothetical protein